MKIPQWIYIAVIALLLILLGAKSCESNEATKTTAVTKDVKVAIPERSGVLSNPTKKEELPVTGVDTVFIGGKAIYIPSPIDEELKDRLKAAEDKYALLLDAARKREYSQDFSDEFVDINVKATVFGKLDSTQIKYKLKPQTVIVPQTTITKETTKTSVLALYGGATLQSNRALSKVVPGIQAGLMLNNNTMLTAGYNTDRDWNVGVKIRIFNINK